MLSVAGIFLKNREHRGYLAPRKSFCPFCRGGVRVRCHPGSPARHQLHSRNCPSRSAPSALNLDPEIWQSSSSRLRKAYVATSPRQGAPKRSDGGLVVVLVLDSVDFRASKRARFPATILFRSLMARYRRPRERGRRRARERVLNFGVYAKHIQA